MTTTKPQEIERLKKDAQQLLRDPRYWRQKDPDVIKQVHSIFREIYALTKACEEEAGK